MVFLQSGPNLAFSAKLGKQEQPSRQEWIFLCDGVVGQRDVGSHLTGTKETEMKC